MKYQFQVDGRAAAPIRDRWKDAAQDAVNQGYAAWTGRGIALADTAGAELASIPDKAVQS